MNQLFRGNSFKIIVRNDIKEFSWNATSVTLPSISMGSPEARIRGIKLNLAGNLDYGKISMQISLKDDLTDYYELFIYMLKQKLNDFQLTDYPFKAQIIINDNKNIKLYTILLEDVLIDMLGELELKTMDREVVTIPINLSFGKIDIK